ncbi:MAG: cell division topological specificity factor MinE [Methylococcales bacterium]|jgi:cell division topological specificity factor|nr:cell division topological specificity factor MinE [Methylococcales bacterium]
MSLLDYFRTKKTSSASIAKERLQILVAHEHAAENQPSYLPELQKELLAVVSKYVEVDLNAITINFEQDEHQDIFELKIDIPSKDD